MHSKNYNSERGFLLIILIAVTAIIILISAKPQLAGATIRDGEQWLLQHVTGVATWLSCCNDD